ncbi:MAG: GIY-YIG nuclease family protein [Caldilineales bacterium]|nr:GIY-YIG nuclease family protein [Caldilineales bacterium]
MNIAGDRASVKASHEAASPFAGKGTYLLRFEIHRAERIYVGRLGAFDLNPGIYVYAGSALGSGGLRARLSRHLRADKEPHWHIDALTNCCTPEIWLVDASDQRLECRWVQTLLAQPGVRVPIAGFGSSDCRQGCPAHLLALPAAISPNVIRRLPAIARTS